MFKRVLNATLSIHIYRDMNLQKIFLFTSVETLIFPKFEVVSNNLQTVNGLKFL